MNFYGDLEKGLTDRVLLDGGIAVSLLTHQLVAAATLLPQLLPVPINLGVVLSEDHFIGIYKILPIGGDQLLDLLGYFLVDLVLGGVILGGRVLFVVLS